MNQNIVIKVENISKKYVIGEKENFPTLRDHLVNLPKKLFTHKKPKEFWALKKISFEVNKGEVLGIIGRNGAGKSTLLKILSRITEPTEGRITLHGKVSSLLEVGTGFNPELTGRENIYLNGSIIGMSRKEIETKFEEIVEFSGVKEFLDTPVKRYSSGMYVRLAFSVSAFLESDILIVDEVLAVGDIEFQKKCLGKMNALAGEGKTVIFVSHSIPAITRMCSKCIWLQKGNVVHYGETQKVIDQYLDATTEKYPTAKPSSLISSCKRFNLLDAYWINSKQQKIDYYKFGESPVLRLKFNFKKFVNNIGFGFALLNRYNDRILTSHQIDDLNSNFPKVFKNKIFIDFNLGLTQLAPGKYRTIIGVVDQKANTTLLYTEDLAELRIKEPVDKIDGASGYLWHTGEWSLVKE